MTRNEGCEKVKKMAWLLAVEACPAEGLLGLINSNTLITIMKFSLVPTNTKMREGKFCGKLYVFHLERLF
jgi:hypothetical protein